MYEAHYYFHKILFYDLLNLNLIFYIINICFFIILYIKLINLFKKFKILEFIKKNKIFKFKILNKI